MRSRKAIINTIVQLVLEIVTIISGFVLPRLIIGTFGSEANGLIVSIAQFFGYLTILQSGIGGVAKAALYKPLADNDSIRIKTLIKTIEVFFRKIGYISIAYLAVLMFVFPKYIYPEGNTIDTVLLVFIIWLGVFSQYYFGITYQFLLQADQRYYIFSLTQIIVVILNTLLSVLLIHLGYSLVVVKFVGAIIFVIRPLLLSVYCKKVYCLQGSCVTDNSLIKQRWDGFGHTIAYFIHSKAAVFILTLFSSLLNVSIYSVYSSVASALTLLMNTISTSLQSAFGNMLAKGEKELLKKNFLTYVSLNNALVMALFSTAIITIIPFMEIYTKSFKNEGYINDVFSFLLLLAEATYCIRMPYQTVVLAAGHYKQTRNGAFVEAGINIIISILLVNFIGLIGVTLGTFSAMLFRTIQYINYLSKSIIDVKLFNQYMRLTIDIAFLALSYFFSCLISQVGIINAINGYSQWFLFLFTTFCVMSVLVFLITMAVDKQSLVYIVSVLKRNINAMLQLK